MMRSEATRQPLDSLFITISNGTRRTKIVEPYWLFAASTSATSGVMNRIDWSAIFGLVTSDHGVFAGTSLRSKLEGGRVGCRHRS